MQIADISDPANPVRTAWVDLYGPRPNDLKVRGNYAFVLLQTGLEIFDISNIYLPKSVSFTEVSGNANSFDMHGNHVIVGTNIGIQVFDIQDLGFPSVSGNVDNLSPILQVEVADNGYLYVNEDGRVKVFDISEVNMPSELGAGYSPFAESFSVDGDFLFISDSYNSGVSVVKVYSIEDAFIADKVGEVQASSGAIKTKVTGEDIFILTENTLDIAKFSQGDLELVGSTRVNSMSRYSADLAVHNGYVYISDGYFSRLQVVDATNTDTRANLGQADLELIDVADTNTRLALISSLGRKEDWFVAPVNRLRGFEGIVLRDDYGYVTTPRGGLEIIDMSNSASLKLLGQVPGESCSYCDEHATIRLNGNYAYLSTQNSISMIDISDVYNPRVVSEFNGTLGVPGRGDLDGYVFHDHANTDSGVQIVDVSDPETPLSIATIKFPLIPEESGLVRSLTVEGTTLFATVFEKGSDRIILHVVDIANTLLPKHLKSIRLGTSHTARNTKFTSVVDGNFLYLTTNQGMYVFDVRDPLSTSVVGYTGTLGPSNDFRLNGNGAYVANGSNGISVVDLDEALRTYTLLDSFYSPVLEQANLISQSPQRFSNKRVEFTKRLEFNKSVEQFTPFVLRSNYEGYENLRDIGHTVSLELKPNLSLPVNEIVMVFKDSEGNTVLIDGKEEFISNTRTNRAPVLATSQSTSVVSNFTDPAVLDIETLDLDGDQVALSVIDSDGGTVSFDRLNKNRLVASFDDAISEHRVTIGLSDGKETTQASISILRFDENSVASFYSDVPLDHEYSRDIAFSTLSNIVSGQRNDLDQSDRLFRPNDYATWAETLKIVLNASSLAGLIDFEARPEYPNVQPAWVMPYYYAALSEDAMQPVEGDLGLLHPNREQVAQLIVKLLKIDEKVSGIAEIAYDFDDNDAFSNHEARIYSEAAHVFGLFMSSDLANPHGNVTRGELARVSTRILMMPEAELNVPDVISLEELPVTVGGLENIRATKLSQNLQLVDSSNDVTVAYALNGRRFDGIEIPTGLMQFGNNQLLAAITNNGISNLYRKTIKLTIIDSDNDSVPDSLDEWPNDNRYVADDNDNGIPDRLDELYDLSGLTLTDTVVIGDETVRISDLINLGPCPAIATKAYNPITNEVRVFDSPCDIPTGWVAGTPDSDSDGVYDFEDNCPFKYNADQTDFDSDVRGDVCDPDDDNDGMPDSWEIKYGLNPKDASDKSGDPDGDGRINLQEYQRGTNPRVRDEIKKVNVSPIITFLLNDEEKKLEALNIIGDASLNERGVANYSAIATFNDGKTVNVTSEVTWSEDSIFSVVNDNGVLWTYSISAQQNVLLKATYEFDSKIVTAEKVVVIHDLQPDVSADITLLGSWNFGQFSKLAIYGDYVYATTYDNSVKIIDISDMSAPFVASTISLESKVDAYSTKTISYNNGYLYLTTDHYGADIEIIDVRNPLSPRQLNGYSIPGASYVNAVVLSQNSLFVHYWKPGNKEIVNIDISDPESPLAISSIPTQQREDALEIIADGDFIYVLYEDTGLEIILIGEEGALKSKSTLVRDGWYKSVVKDDQSRLVISDWSRDELAVVTVDDDLSLSVSSVIPTSGNSTELIYENGYLLYLDRGIKIGNNDFSVSVAQYFTLESFDFAYGGGFLFSHAYLIGVNGNGLKIFKVAPNIFFKIPPQGDE